MIRLLSLKKQNETMQRLIRIILELRKNLPDVSARDAIDDAFEIALIVGGQEMVEHMSGTEIKKVHRSIVDEIGDGLSKCIDYFDAVVDGFEK